MSISSRKIAIGQVTSDVLRRMTVGIKDVQFMAYQVSFLKDVFLKSFFVCCIVWFFMIVQFWWGNHDWGYLKNAVGLTDGFFEARYSQHLFTALFFDGQVLPVAANVCAIMFLVLLAILSAVYLEVPEKKHIFYVFVLFMCLNPYVFVFFYYVYLAVAFMAWPFVGVCGLLLAEKHNWGRFVLGSVIWFLLLGSYPPNMALVMVLFCAKRVISYYEGKESLLQVFRAFIYLGAQLLSGFIGFKLVYMLLIAHQRINLDMYNIKMKSFMEIVGNFPHELFMSVAQLFDFQTFMGWDYCVLLALLVVVAVWMLFAAAEGTKRAVLMMLLLLVFSASRFAFLVSAQSDVGVFRMQYFGRVGIELFALAVLGRMKKQWVQNFYVLWGIVVLALFVVRDYDIQKIQFLGFHNGRKYQARLFDKVREHPALVMAPKYISFSFGYPNFRRHYLDDTYQSGEFAGYSMVFDFDIVASLFWEERVQPVGIGSGIYGNTVLRVERNQSAVWKDMDYWLNNPENMKNIRYWLYQEAKLGDVYVDDKYIILVLDMFDFYKYRELLLGALDKQ